MKSKGAPLYADAFRSSFFKISYNHTGFRKGDFLMKEFKISPEGDRALVADFGNVIDEGINDKVHMLASLIRSRKIKGVQELLPTYRSLVVFYDPRIIMYDELRKTIETIEPGSSSGSAACREVLEVPCCYADEFAPDIQGLSELSGLSANEIITAHTSPLYKIFMMGFLPGFVYLGGLDPRIAAPRLENPRTSIPDRSVGIGGSQTGVYPISSPGGWRLIGSTPLEFYDPLKADPILCHAGEYIRFLSISHGEYDSIRKDVENGIYKPQIRSEKATAAESEIS